LGLLKDKELLVGAIDVATNDIEAPEQVMATLEAAMEFADPERILPCTNCGLAPLPRSVAVGKLKALGAGTRMLREKLG
jgi:5-methyltetrahydropteroyltriglutamate--homocysteine methyltransferase